MQFGVSTVWLTAFCLGLVRAGGFIVVCPPFSAPGIPQRVKVALSVAFALASTGSQPEAVLNSTGEWIGQLVFQAAMGVLLGFGVLAMFSAIGIAGELADLSVGFGAAQALDPTTGASAGALSRFYTMIATALLFASGSHLLLVRGFVRAGSGMSSMSLEHLGRSLIMLTATMLVAALEIALPLMAALLAAEVGLGLLGKASPQLNVFQLGFAAKIVLAFMLLGTCIALLPEQVAALIDTALSFMAGVKSG